MISGTTATITGLNNGTQYAFVVTAINAAGESAASAVATATPATVTTSAMLSRYGTSPVIPNVATPWEAGSNYPGPVLYENGTYKMYYFGCKTSVVTTGYGAVGYATSTDGILWTRNSSPILNSGASYTFDGNYPMATTVIKDGALYKMWYWGYQSPSSGIIGIGYATSPDGIAWTKDVTSAAGTRENYGLDDGSGAYASYCPCVVKVGTTYHMYYVRNTGTFDICHATSTDGQTWTKDSANPVIPKGSSGFDSQGTLYPSVIYTGSKFVMWYEGSNGSSYAIGYAESNDGSTWTKGPNNPVLSAGSAGNFDSSLADYMSVVFDGSVYRIYYSGYNGSKSQIGMATLP